MRNCPYASAVGSLMYVMLCTRPDICYAVRIVSRYQSNPGSEHWTTVKNILKYLNRTKHYFLVFGGEDSDFQLDIDDRKSISGFIFTIGKGAISWRSCKQDTTADSTIEAKYIAAKEAVWICKFIQELEVVPSIESPITIYCDNSGAVANAVEPMAHQRTKHIARKYHLICDIIQRGDVAITKIASANNVADPLTKALSQKVFEKHLEAMGIKYMYDWFLVQVRDCWNYVP